jgi:hypothetical protein
MADGELVLVDTCIWVPFFNRPQSPEKRVVDQLLDEDRVALVGPILTEVLQGFRRDEQADWLRPSCAVCDSWTSPGTSGVLLPGWAAG